MKKRLVPHQERRASRLNTVTLLIYLIFRVEPEKCWAGRSTAIIKIAKNSINNLKYADNTTRIAESKELKSLLMKVKEESEKLA